MRVLYFIKIMDLTNDKFYQEFEKDTIGRKVKVDFRKETGNK